MPFFIILPPLWQRWWFLSPSALGIGLTALAFYRSRIRRVVELERVRTRIATDLHDDIGSSLSQIDILRENGRGFDPNGDAATSRNGNGLASMRERAHALGGEIETISQPDLGTAVKLDFPLSPRAGLRWRKYLPV